MDRLFDEDLLLGRGYTTHESLRPLAYSTLADLVHHVRTQLNLNILAKAVHLFSKNVHDESLPTSIQTMSCKLLLNLVDCIRQRADTDLAMARELLLTMLKVFTLKFHTIAKLQLPLIMQKWKALSNQTSGGSTSASSSTQNPATPGIVAIPPIVATTGTTTPAESSAPATSKEFGGGIDISSETMSKLVSIGFPAPNNLNVSEYRSLIKTLVCGVKTITWGLPQKPNVNEPQVGNTRMFTPDEMLIFIDLFNWALEALDIYMINIPTPGQQGANSQQKPLTQMPRSKEEKEVLEHFSTVFLTMKSQNFQEMFSATINFMVERIAQNSALQVRIFLLTEILSDK
jgi:transformation/transcription domain-associated protein